MKWGNGEQISAAKDNWMLWQRYRSSQMWCCFFNKHATATVNSHSIWIQKRGIVYRKASSNNAFAHTSWWHCPDRFQSKICCQGTYHITQNKSKVHVHSTILANRILAVLAPQDIFILLVFSTKLGEVSKRNRNSLFLGEIAVFSLASLTYI